MDQGGEHGSEICRVQLVENPLPDGLTGHQVQLGVDAREHPTTVGDLVPVVGQIPQGLQHQTDAVEPGRDGGGAAARLGLSLVPGPLQAHGTFGESRMGLTIWALVARMGTDRRPQVGDLIGQIGVRRCPVTPVGFRTFQTGRCRVEVSPQCSSGGRIAGMEVFGDVDPRHPVHRGVDVVIAQGDDRVPLDHRHHPDRRRSSTASSSIQHHCPAGMWPAGHGDDVSHPEFAHRVEDLGPGSTAACPGLFRLQLGDLLTHRGVLGEVTQLAVCCCEVVGDGLFVLTTQPGPRTNSAVGLELGEGVHEKIDGLVPAHRVHQVDGHVVGGLECRPEWIGASGRQSGHGSRIHPGLPADDGMPLGVDAASTRPAGELGVLTCGDVGVGLAVVLDEFLQDDGTCRHVDSQGEGLGGDDDLEQTTDECLLHHGLLHRKQAGVMGGKPPLQM